MTMPDTDNSKPPVLDPGPAPLPPPPSHLLARLLNVFAMPGQVFDEVCRSRHAGGNWFFPALLCAISMGLAAYALFCSPTVWTQFAGRHAEVRAAQAGTLAEAVTAGKITQADADQSLKAFDLLARPEVMRPAAAAVGFLVGLARVFWWGFVLWLLARIFLRHPVRYSKALEVAGLASMLAVLSTVLLLALLVNVGKTLADPGFALSVADIAAPGNRTLAVIALNAMNFWLISVLGIGLARMTGQPWIRGVFLVFGYWLLAGLLLLPFGFLSGLAG